VTIYDIKRIHEEKDSDYFFSLDTMKFFHQTLKSFSVKYLGNDKYRISAPMRDFSKKIVGFTVRIFDYNTGKLEFEKEEE